MSEESTEGPSGLPAPDAAERAACFEAERPRLFALAYRMLGSAADAEDLLQEAYLRFAKAGKPERPGPFLTTVVTRLAIDHLRSARVRRERYVGPWLPEPLVATARGPSDEHELAESLSMAFLVLLEGLSPAERAAYLLHDVLGLPFEQVAGAIGRSAAGCRQLASRARKHLRQRSARFPARPEDAERLAFAFFAAVRGGDLDALVATLLPDAVMVSDGGGAVKSARRPVHGARNVARFVLGIASKAPDGLRVEPRWVNGAPGLLFLQDGVAWRVCHLDLAPEGVRGVYFVANPAKLAALGAARGEVTGSPPSTSQGE